MSDFDKEAERQKLREQFAADDDDRATTERMSELLLQGATMTNRHCDTCGNPIFRYDDRAFCPSCQQPADGDGASGAGTDGEPAGAAEATPAADGESGGRQPAPDELRADADRTAAEEGDPAPPAAATGDPAAVDRQAVGRSDPATRPGGTRTHAATDDGTAGTAPPGDATPGSGLAEARAALERTTTRLARLAEDSDDLGRTREHLAAAREAAEALAAVKRAGR